MTNRGMTLLELVLSVTLLSAISVVCLSWVEFAGRSSAQVAGPMRWRIAAEALLADLQDEVRTGDLDADSGASEVLKVFEREGALTVLTRSSTPPRGAVLRRYRLDHGGRLVVTTSRASQQRGPPPEPHMLLTRVARFDYTVDALEKNASIRLVSQSGDRVEGRLRR